MKRTSQLEYFGESSEESVEMLMTIRAKQSLRIATVVWLTFIGTFVFVSVAQLLDLPTFFRAWMEIAFPLLGLMGFAFLLFGIVQGILALDTESRRTRRIARTAIALCALPIVLVSIAVVGAFL